MKHVSILMGLALVAPATFASEYNVEVNPTYSSLDSTTGSDSILGIGGSYYFAPVKSAPGPLAEAAFLRHASNVYAGYLSVDKADVDSLTGGIELFNDALYLDLSVTKNDNAGVNSTDLSANLGYMINDTTRIDIGFDKDDAAGVDTLSLNVKSVMLMVGDTALNLQGSISRDDDPNDTMTYYAQADYYFNPVFGAGISLQDDDVTGSKTALGINLSMFFTDQVGVFAGYTTNSGGVADDDTVTVTAAIRF